MKQQKSTIELYKRRQKLGKAYGLLSPIVFWGAIGLAILFLIIAVHTSVGNVKGVWHELDWHTYYNEQSVDEYIAQGEKRKDAEEHAKTDATAVATEHYDALCEEYGELPLNHAGKVINFVRVLTNKGFLYMWLSLSLIFFLIGTIFGKWWLPYSAKRLQQNNQDMTNIAQLEEIDRQRAEREQNDHGKQ